MGRDELRTLLAVLTFILFLIMVTAPLIALSGIFAR